MGTKLSDCLVFGGVAFIVLAISAFTFYVNSLGIVAYPILTQ